MNTSFYRSTSFFSHGGVRTGLLVFLFAISFSHGPGAECEPPQQPSGPAAGTYKGYFRLICEMHLPAAPALVVPIKIEGDLSFKLGRQDLEDPPPPVPPPHYTRRPIQPPRPPSGAKNPDPAAAAEAVNEAAASDAALAAAEAKADSGYLYIPPNENPRVEGTSQVSMDASFQLAGSGAQVTEQVGTKRTLPFEVRGEESSRTGNFDELSLWGTKDQAALAGGFTLSGEDARGTGALDFSNTGATGKVTGESDRGSVSRDVSINTGAPNSPPPSEDKYQRARREFDEAYDRLFGKPVTKLKLLTLTVTSTACGSLRGTVRAEEFEANLKKNGGALVVKESEWVATLEERDPAFEQRVQSLASEPIPTPITWAYIDSFADRWKALRQEANTDYRRCVAKELARKYVAIQGSALRELANNVPQARYGANCTVMRAAFERSLPIIRTLQLYGVGDCPVIRDYWAAVEREMQAIVKQLLARNPSPTELACYFPIARQIDLGEQTVPFWTAWHEVEVAASQRHP